MRISVHQSGGFAGVDVDLGSVDTATMPAHEAAHIQAAVEQALVNEPAGSSVGADFVKYEVTVEDRGQRRNVTIVDDLTPQSERLMQVVHAVSPYLK